MILLILILVLTNEMVQSTKFKADNFSFVHIHKTGTSVITLLRQAVDSCTVKGYTCSKIGGGGPHPSNTLSRKYIERLSDSVHNCNGHLRACKNLTDGYKPELWLTTEFEENWNTAAVIRQPVERFISEVVYDHGFGWISFYCRSNQTCFGNRVWQHVNEGRIKLSDILDERKAPSLLQWTNDSDMIYGRSEKIRDRHPDNRITRVLSGERWDSDLRGRESKVLQTAVSNLRRLTFFGLTEIWAQSVCLFHAVFDAGPPQHSELVDSRSSRGNDIASWSERVDPTVFSLFAKFNLLDLQLYNQALLIFSDRLSKTNCSSTVKRQS